MDLKKIHTLYFLGIGGIGMSALARYFNSLGVKIFGYDKTQTILTKELEQEGMIIHYEENISALPENIDVVVYTPAIPKEHKEFLYFKSQNVKMIKRSEMLSIVTQDTFTIAVSGTHGKTSITSMIAHILICDGKKVNAFVGGIMKNYNSNLIISKDADYTVVEADEFDRSFLTLNPDIAVISSMDADHLDIYGTKENLQESFFLFANKIKSDGSLLIKGNLKFEEEVKSKTYRYSLDNDSDFFASDFKIEKGKFIFSINAGTEIIDHIAFGLPGRHNAENAIAAAAVALLLKIDIPTIKHALETYQGVQRRFDYRINTNDLVYIDDYAHHPEELKACISSVKELYSDKKICGIFQPHLYSRTRDFADEFAKSLELLDDLILLEIYPARELPIEGITSEMLLGKVKIKNKLVCKKEELLDILKKKKLEVLLTLGAGDIDQFVLPIESYFLKKSK
jgi:UDP-N-acetylmuramate--alanine ligase